MLCLSIIVMNETARYVKLAVSKTMRIPIRPVCYLSGFAAVAVDAAENEGV